MNLQKLAEYLGYGFISWAIGASLVEIHSRVFPDGKQETSFQYIIDKLLAALAVIFLFLGAGASVIVGLISMARIHRIIEKEKQEKAADLSKNLDEVGAAYLRGKNDGYLAGYNDCLKHNPLPK